MWEYLKEKKFQSGQEQQKRLREKKSVIKNGWLHLLALIALVSIIQYGRKKYPEWREAHSGVPDVVGSMSMNNDHYLKVVANSSKIEDKEEFAAE